MSSVQKKAAFKVVARSSVPQTAADELVEMKAYVTEVAKSKSESIAFLQRAGILDKKGSLAKPYRG